MTKKIKKKQAEEIKVPEAKREYLGMSYETLTPVVTLLLAGERFGAVVAYRKITGKEADVCVSEVISLLDTVKNWILEDKSFSSLFIPEKCCIKCIGCCGMYKEKMKNSGWDNENFCFEGIHCSKFRSEKEFLASRATIGARRKTDDKFIFNTVFQVEEKISSISLVRINRRNNASTAKKRIVIQDASVVLEKIIEKLRNGHLVHPKESDISDSLMIDGKFPLEGEEYPEYFSRCQKEVREKTKQMQKEVYAMDYSQALSFFTSQMTEAERKVYETYSSVNRFISDFYPNLSIWQVIEEKKKRM